MTTPMITAWTNSYGTKAWLITFVSTLTVSNLNTNALQVLIPWSKTLRRLSSSKKKKWMRYMKAQVSPPLLMHLHAARRISPSLVSMAHATTLPYTKTIRIRTWPDTMIISAKKLTSIMMLMKFASMKTINPSLTLSASSSDKRWLRTK